MLNLNLTQGMVVRIAFVMMGLVAGAAVAQEKADLEDSKPKEQVVDQNPEYGGVVIDQTLTGLGRYFYVKFSAAWSERGNADAYVLAIKELPSSRGGTDVVMYSNEVPVLRTVLPRSYTAVSSLSEAAVEQVYSFLEQQRIQAALFVDTDLAPRGL
jgi:curli production assembly/transport component CsgE